jgi:hypothetical protein
MVSTGSRTGRRGVGLPACERRIDRSVLMECLNHYHANLEVDATGAALSPSPQPSPTVTRVQLTGRRFLGEGARARRGRGLAVDLIHRLTRGQWGLAGARGRANLEYGAVRRFGCGRVEVRPVHPGARTETSLNRHRPISRSPHPTSIHQITRSRTLFGVPGRGWGHVTGGVASLDPRLISGAPLGACSGGRFARCWSAVWSRQRPF